MLRKTLFISLFALLPFVAKAADPTIEAFCLTSTSGDSTVVSHDEATRTTVFKVTKEKGCKITFLTFEEAEIKTTYPSGAVGTGVTAKIGTAGLGSDSPSVIDLPADGSPYKVQASASDPKIATVVVINTSTSTDQQVTYVAPKLTYTGKPTVDATGLFAKVSMVVAAVVSYSMF